MIAAIGSRLPYDLILDLDFSASHETALSLAKAIAAAMAMYAADGVSASMAVYAVADNTSVCNAGINVLRAAPYLWEIEYVRDIPHLLALVLVAFISIFDKVSGVCMFPVNSYQNTICGF